jgi:hypothetical protein
MQASSSITAFPSAMLMASLGHSDTQDSQPVHFSLSTFADIYKTLSKNMILMLFSEPLIQIGYGMLQNYNDITNNFFKEITLCSQNYTTKILTNE